MDRLVFGSFLAPSMLPVYEAVAEHVGHDLGMRAELVVGRSFDDLAPGRIDVAFLCGLPYVRLADRLTILGAPVLSGERYGGRPVYFSDVVVRADHPARTFADLRGCTWTFNEPDSHSGCTAVLGHLHDRGLGGDFFGRVVAAGFHQRALQLVLDGAADASAIDSQVLAIELRDHPELADRIRVIGTIGPSPIQPVVAAAHVPASVTEAVGDSLLSLQDAARDALALGFVDRFVRVVDADYDPIRRTVSRTRDIAAAFLEAAARPTETS